MKPHQIKISMALAPALALMLSLPGGAALADGGARLTLHLKLDDTGTLFAPKAEQDCSWKGGDPTGAGEYQLKILVKQGTARANVPDSVTLEAQMKAASGKGAGSKKVLKTWKSGADLKLDKLSISSDVQHFILVDTMGTELCRVPVQVAGEVAAAVKPAARKAEEPGAQYYFAKANADAEAFLVAHKAPGTTEAAPITDHELQGGKFLRGRKVTLYHLPDGSPAFPIPLHLTEKDEITIKVTQPPGAQVKVDIMACDKVPALRVQGSFADATSAFNKLSRPARETFSFKTHTKVLECAGSLSYKITTTLADGNTSVSTITIAIDPIYHFAWGVAAVFDFGKRSKFSLKDRPVAGTTTAEKYIALEDDYSGMRPLVVLGVYPFGANPRDWGVRDYFSFLIGVDPSNFTDGFVWGIGFTPLPGIGLMGGMSIYSTQELDEKVVAPNGKALIEGDTFKATGDLPTKTVFNSDSVGGFIGLTVTSEALKALMD